ncbi:MAG: hypothetical protein A2W90_09985 [Bacteroidetes bacterium GWF2_42_66]|nr:MAG: hypothetical protein A2W92_05015 [Bacteroidetes bacterium GWA2_42_15]OFX97509.1 MAG: hypothetical protein A2W89_01420 [Bacteroidetes bacterium GWE2_42_39]OFY43797.1 MAG: hypothetical protein A2W90_09985 [Bacteroidetes bacterium GWF2_42_66]HBL76223.1 hypothetical protein [Prolixibacteraceae bacterium]HCR89277.1 hypothetical protein [Prolixibacteraceae bacterium]
MKVLLVYPQCPDSYRSFRHAFNFLSKKAAVLGSVSAMLPATWQKKLVDMNVATLHTVDIQWADYVFISAMYIQKESVNKVISVCKKLDKKIVAGGPLFTQEHSNYPQIDHFILNETKITMPLFLADLSAGKPQRMYMTDRYANRSQTSAHDYHLPLVNDNAIMNIKVSTRCPFACNFREVASLLGHRLNIQRTSQSIDEMNIQFHSVFFISFPDKNMRKCWKLIVWPYFNRPGSVIDAAIFTIYDHQFKTISGLKKFENK